MIPERKINTQRTDRRFDQRGANKSRNGEKRQKNYKPNIANKSSNGEKRHKGFDRGILNSDDFNPDFTPWDSDCMSEAGSEDLSVDWFEDWTEDWTEDWLEGSNIDEFIVDFSVLFENFFGLKKTKVTDYYGGEMVFEMDQNMIKKIKLCLDTNDYRTFSIFLPFASFLESKYSANVLFLQRTNRYISYLAKYCKEYGVEISELDIYCIFQTLKFIHSNDEKYSYIEDNIINILLFFYAKIVEKYKISIQYTLFVLGQKKGKVPDFSLIIQQRIMNFLP